MNILYFHTGRVERREANLVQVLEMCRALTRLGQSVTLAVNSRTLPEARCREVLEAQLGGALPFALQVYRGRHLAGRLQALGTAGTARSLARSGAYDLMILRHPVPLPFVRHTPCPIVFEAHNTLCFDGVPLLEALWRARIVRMARHDRLRLFVTISEALRAWWEAAGVPPEKLCALHDGVDADFVPAALSATEARERTGLPREARVVLYAGSLHAERGIDWILRLAAERPDAQFVLVGGPEAMADRYREKARALKLVNVRLVGRVHHHDVPAYLVAADVLLMLWSWEVKTIAWCSPLKLFEYMAAGRTIVGQAFPTIREVVQHGVHALLADPSSFDDLRLQLDWALDAPEPALGRAARDRVLRHYTWEIRCRALLARLAP